MEPTLHTKGLVLVDHKRPHPHTKSIYVIRIADGLGAKRLEVNMDTHDLLACSAPPLLRHYGDGPVIGRVVGLQERDFKRQKVTPEKFSNCELNALEAPCSYGLNAILRLSKSTSQILRQFGSLREKPAFGECLFLVTVLGPSL